MLYPCASCRSTGRVGAAICTAPPAEAVGDRDWSTCVYGLLADGWWSAVMVLDAAAQVSAIAGWPHEWSCGTVDALVALRAARLEAEAAAVRKASRG